MPLKIDLESLQQRTLADLASAHDYYTDTKIAWNLVTDAIAAGRTFAIRNTTTGTVTTQVELEVKAHGYVTVQLAEATFQQFLSIFEDFFFDLLGLWLTAHPESLGGKVVEFRTILELPDKLAITQLVVRKELNEILYDRPKGWFAYLEKRARLGCPTPGEVDRIAEAKASRDVLVHNKGIANPTYVSKAGPLARSRDGERVEISEQYHRATWELIRKMVSEISDAAIAKA